MFDVRSPQPDPVCTVPYPPPGKVLVDAALVAKVREFVNHAHGEHTGEDLRGYAKDLAAILPAE